MENQDEPDWFRNALSCEAVGHSLEVDGGVISYRQWGDPAQQAVVLVHGNGAQSHWWDHIAPFLTETHSVWALDLSGHGDSGRRDRYNADVWATDLIAVTEVASGGSPAPIVIAHSLGGRVAATAAARVGKNWRGLVLVDSALGPTRVGSPPPVRTDVPVAAVYETASAALKRFRLRPPQPNSLPCVVDHIARTSLRETSQGWEWKVDPRTSLRGEGISVETLGKIECDIILLRAEHGRVAPDAGIWLSSSVGRPVPVAEIPLAHHHVMIDQPIALVAAIRAVLSLWSIDDPGRTTQADVTIRSG